MIRVESARGGERGTRICARTQDQGRTDGTRRYLDLGPGPLDQGPLGADDASNSTAGAGVAAGARL